MLAGAFAVKAKELFKSFDELKTGSASLLLRGLEQGTTQIRTLMFIGRKSQKAKRFGLRMVEGDIFQSERRSSK